MGVRTARIVVLASGKGSNLRALHAHSLAQEDCPFEIVAVLSDKAQSGAVAYANEQGIPVALVPFNKDDERLKWDERLSATIDGFKPDWVVLAGFMRIVGGHTVRAFEGRMINIHPSLLPSFRGLHAVRQALKAGVRITGCTVHLVDHDVDTGPILGQAAVAVNDDDNEGVLQERIQRVEHRLLPAVINKLCGAATRAVQSNELLVV